MIAPVDGSGCWPAWTATVESPGARSFSALAIVLACGGRCGGDKVIFGQDAVLLLVHLHQHGRVLLTDHLSDGLDARAAVDDREARAHHLAHHHLLERLAAEHQPE